MKNDGQRDKIAFVCQRYGLEVNGGAELHCRQVAEKLSGIYDVTVYTTCAIDYMTWKNEYEPGTEEINGVHVRRFRVWKERNQDRFNRLSQCVFSSERGHTDAQEERWVDAQGPFCPELIEMITEEHKQYKVVFFMTYLYYTTARGLPRGFDNAVLIPTVHDEPPVYLRYYEKVFANARAIAWNTVTERAFATKRFPFLEKTPGVIMGLGINGPVRELPELPAVLKDTDYILYVGRIDENKGCSEMFEFYKKYNQEHGGSLKLVLIGKAVMDVPEDTDIINLGFVSEEMKFTVIKNALALVLFSRYESLSMVVLESMLMGRPVLVTEYCEVLKGHCLLSNAGLYFKTYNEFSACIDYFREHPGQYKSMCENGRKYVTENYSWDAIVAKFCELIDKGVPSNTAARGA